MGDNKRDAFDPFLEMQNFYRSDDPTEEQQFRFVEAMKMLIDGAAWESDIVAFSYNLAIYYRNIREFDLEKKYLELGAKYGSSAHKEELGFIWYYGLTGEQDFGKAYHCFSECDTRKSRFMLADMYHDGIYVQYDPIKCWDIIEELFSEVESERNDPRFTISTLYPEIALRMVRLNLEAGTEDNYDWNNLLDARSILARRQCYRPFWGNIKTMHGILDTMTEMRESDYGLIDLYDLLTFEESDAAVLFDFGGITYRLNIFQHERESIYDFENKWYHGAEDFFEKVRIEGIRITTVMQRIENIRVHRYTE